MDRPIKLITATTAIATVLAMVGIVHAERDDSGADGKVKQILEMPVTAGWYKGKQTANLQTKALDTAVAATPHGNYVPKLPFVFQAPSVSSGDIYWQLSKATWADASKAHTLKSEEESLAAEAAKFVTNKRTQIELDCPITSSPQGGTLSTVTALIGTGPRTMDQGRR